VTHSDIVKDGVSLPLSNVAIGTTGSRSGKSDRSRHSYFFILESGSEIWPKGHLRLLSLDLKFKEQGWVGLTPLAFNSGSRLKAEASPTWNIK
jgi:hypothetical protein